MFLSRFINKDGFVVKIGNINRSLKRGLCVGIKKKQKNSMEFFI